MHILTKLGSVYLGHVVSEKVQLVSSSRALLDHIVEYLPEQFTTPVVGWDDKLSSFVIFVDTNYISSIMMILADTALYYTSSIWPNIEADEQARISVYRGLEEQLSGLDRLIAAEQKKLDTKKNKPKAKKKKAN